MTSTPRVYAASYQALTQHCDIKDPGSEYDFARKEKQARLKLLDFA